MNAAPLLMAGLALVILVAQPAASETIQLQREHDGIYMVTVRINDAVAIPFVLDSGAAEVSIPADPQPRWNSTARAIAFAQLDPSCIGTDHALT
jgi:predicted aspartyl protease